MLVCIHITLHPFAGDADAPTLPDLQTREFEQAKKKYLQFLPQSETSVCFVYLKLFAGAQAEFTWM